MNARAFVDSVAGRRPPVTAAGGRRIRGGSGLGDALYIRPIAEHFVAGGEAVTVFSDYADVFLGAGVTVKGFTRKDINVLAHYTGGKYDTRTTQWEDVCASARVRGLPLSFAWEIRNPGLIAGLRERAAGRPLVLVHGGRRPMARTDGFGMELLPRREAFEDLLRALSSCYLVGIGRDEPIYPLPVDVDLNGSTSVSDLLDLARSCDAVVGQCSFAIPLSEVFDRPLLVLWSASGLASRDTWVRAVTPRKIFAKPSSIAVRDDASPEALADAARDLISRATGGLDG